MERASEDKKLFTPGPLNTSPGVREAMLRDLGSRDVTFIQCVKEVRSLLLQVAQVPEDTYTAVPLQGSGTYCVEAVLQTTSPRHGAKVLVLANGAYGRRMVSMCECAGIEVVVEHFPEDRAIDPDKVSAAVHGGGFTTVAVVHCETSTGVVNPVEEVARRVHQACPDAAVVVDAMSSLGAIPLDVAGSGVTYVVSSANKCLQGVPGFSFAVCLKEHLYKCKGNARVLSLDLVAQEAGLAANGQFRFTPPTHALLAFRTALQEWQEEGGLQGRAKRYRENRGILQAGMARLGYRELVPEGHAGYIITSFHFPDHQAFDFAEFYGRLSDKGQVIYPGKVSSADCFRVGNIGHLFPADMTRFIHCVQEVMGDMGLPVPLP